jgi:hypothetical protein
MMLYVTKKLGIDHNTSFWWFHKDAIWYNLLSFKYGELLKFFCGDYIATNRTSSDWWRDLVKIGVGSGALIGWFHDVVCNKEIRNWS